MTNLSNKKNIQIAFALLTAATLIGCGDDPTGSLQVLLGAEDTIGEGIASGSGDEDILDGFSIQFEKFIITIGRVNLGRTSSSATEQDERVYAVDLTSVDENGLELWNFDGIDTGRWDLFSFETPIPDLSTIRDQSVETDDLNMMIANGWSYLIRGTLTEDGEGGIVQSFEIGADVPSVYSECGDEDALQLGVVVTQDGSSAEITIHGDHIVFNGFPEGEENVMRLAEWMSMINDIGDAGLEQADFEAATNVGTLFPTPPYSFPAEPTVNDAWDFVRAQLNTQGHINGEGECEWDPDVL